MPLDVLWVSIISNCNLRNKISVPNVSSYAPLVLNLPKNIANTINFNLGCCSVRSKEIAQLEETGKVGYWATGLLGMIFFDLHCNRGYS